MISQPPARPDVPPRSARSSDAPKRGPARPGRLAEPGCMWFDWSRSLDDPNEYVLVEAFRDGDAGAAHVQSEHFKTAQQTLPPHLAETPRIVSVTIPQDDWSELGELAVQR